MNKIAMTLSPLPLLLVIGGASALPPNTRAVVLSDQQAVGTPPGVIYNFCASNPVIDESGLIAFAVAMSGPGVNVSNANAIYAETAPGTPALLVREANQAPGLPAGVVFGNQDPESIGPNGDIAFVTALTGTGINSTNNIALWSGDSNGVSVLIRKGDQAPGTDPGVVFQTLVVIPPLNADGHTVFRGLLTGPGVNATNSQGIWRTGPGGAVDLVARGGSPAPGAGGINFLNLGTDPVMNVNGDTAFGGTLVAGPTTDSGIWTDGAGGGIELLAREGDPAPGTPAGTVFANIDPLPTISAGGEVLFFAQLTGAGVTGDNDTGLWSGTTAADLSLVVREGDPAPGTPAGTLFGNIGSRPSITAGGRVAFSAALAGPGINSDNDSGAWVESAGGSIGLLLREGDQVPGLPAGVVFDRVLSPPAINSNGQTAIVNQIEGPGVTSSDNVVLFSANDGDPLAVVVREGDMIDVSGTTVPDIRTVSGVGLLVGRGRADGRPAGLAETGDLAYRLFFDDTGSGPSTGVFVRSADTPCVADFAAPFGTLNFFDVAAFISAYSAQDPAADLAAPSGVWNFFDVSAYIAAYNAGCP